MYYHRALEGKISSILARNKSILLLGPRQTGKTTLLQNQCKPDWYISLLDSDAILRYARQPSLIRVEILGLEKKEPLVIIDEIQHAPQLMDEIQSLIDSNAAKFILTGSSARKLRRNKQINLLPGRVILLRLDPISIQEISKHPVELETLLTYGSLPEILTISNPQEKEELLTSYVKIYLEEEIRSEATVRNLGSFIRFLELAAIDAGNTINISKLSQELGISRHTISEYYQILDDCLLVDTIEPIVKSTTRRKLTHAIKYLFFDMGVQRIAANLGPKLDLLMLSKYFENFIGVELIRIMRLLIPNAKLRYWRDHNGPEVDYVIDVNQNYIPIEVKWTDVPKNKDYQHLLQFMEEYSCEIGYIVCRTTHILKLHEKIIGLPWQNLAKIIEKAHSKYY